jgi:hypothetical protein
MHVVKEYMQNAWHCREIAANTSNVEYKRTLEAMADNWAQLAADRKLQVTQGKRARRARRRTTARWPVSKQVNSSRAPADDASAAE